jgi:prepilin peptidase CpaA
MRSIVPLASAVVITAIAAVMDLRTGRIPNWLSLGSVPFSMLWHISWGASRAGVRGALGGAAISAGGFLVCAIVPIVLYRCAGMGGGDVKLFASLGALCGSVLGLQMQWFANLALALFLFARLAYEGRLIRTFVESISALVQQLRPRRLRPPPPAVLRRTVRLGPAIFVGVVATAAGSLIP